MEIKESEKAAVSVLGKKLQHLGCDLLGNGEDSWLTELFLLPGNHRMQLFEWILSKLDYNSPNFLQPQTPVNKHAEDLLSRFVDLGLCKCTDINLVLGKFSKHTQLQFWQQLVAILCEKFNISRGYDWSKKNGLTEQEINVMPKVILDDTSLKVSQNSIEEEYERSCSFLHAVATGISMKSLQEDKVVHFPPDVKRNMTNILSHLEKDVLLSLPTLKTKANTKHKGASENVNVQNCTLALSDKFVVSVESDAQRHMNMKIKCAIEESVTVAKEFLNFSEELKSFVKTEDASSADIGSSLGDLHRKQKLLSQMWDNLDVTKTSYSKLLLNKEASTNACFESLISETSLEKYIKILQQGSKLKEQISDDTGSLLKTDSALRKAI